MRLTLIFFIFFQIICASSFGKSCFESPEVDDRAKRQLQAELVCQNSYDDCHQLLIEQQRDKLEDLNQANIMCEQSDIQVAGVIPISATAFGLKSFASPFTQVTQRQYVNSIVDFYHHTDLHIKRVGVLGEKLFKTYQKQFPGLTLDQVKYALRWHDIEKLDPKILSKDGKPFIVELYKYYGGQRPPMDLIHDLNDAGKKVLDQQLRAKGFSEQGIESLKKLERIVDVVERTENPVSPEEFNRSMFRESASEPTRRNAELRSMYYYLERNYKDLVPDHLTYKPLSGEAYKKVYSKIFLESKLASLMSKSVDLASSSKAAASYVGKVIQSRFPAGSGKLATKVALSGLAVGATAVDFVLLAGYSGGQGCTELGYTDWVKKDGKCIPAPGMSESFIENMLMKDYKNDSTVYPGSNSCKVLSNNLVRNEANIFETTCVAKGLRAKLNDKQVLDVEYDFNGKIKQIHFNGNFTKTIGKSPSGAQFTRVLFDSKGQVDSICSSGSLANGYKKNENEYCGSSSAMINQTNSQFDGFLSAMSYKVNQAIGCCEGAKSEFNENIICSI